MANPREMTPDVKPLIEALMRIVAFPGQRDANAEQMLLDAIYELARLRHIVASQGDTWQFARDQVDAYADWVHDPQMRARVHEWLDISHDEWQRKGGAS